MSFLVSLLTLSVEDVQRSIAAIIDARSRPDAVAEYVASIDWSGAKGDEPAARVLGAVEHLSTELAEADISELAFWSGLQALMAQAPPVVR